MVMLDLNFDFDHCHLDCVVGTLQRFGILLRFSWIRSAGVVAVVVAVVVSIKLQILSCSRGSAMT